MINLLEDLVITRVDLVDEGANAESFIKIFKRRGEGGTSMKLEDILKSLEEEQAATVKSAIEAAIAERDAAAEKLAEAEAEVVRLEGELEKAQEPEVLDEEEDVLKKVSPEVKALIEKARLQAQTAENEVKKMLDREADREAIAKAKQIEGLGSTTEEMTGVMKALSGTNKDLADKVFNILKTAHKVVEESKAFVEVGKQHDSQLGDADAAWALIESKAGEIAKARGITKEAAVHEAISENPDLYKQYVELQ